MCELRYEDKPQYLEIEILTPTHVGVAKENYWLPKADFHWDSKERKIYRYNVMEYLRQNPNEDIINNLTDALRENNVSIKDTYIKGLIAQSKANNQVFDLSFNPGSNGIRPQIRTGMGFPILPGSSLKGAVRSILYNHLLPKDDKNKDASSFDKTEAIFGKINNNLMRLIRISDAEFLPDATELWITKIRSLLKNEGKKFKEGWKDRYDPELRKNITIEQFNLNIFATVYETLSEGTKAYFIVKIAKELYTLIEGKPIDHKGHTYAVPNGDLVKNKSLSDIFSLINDYTLKYLKAEIDFIDKTKGEKSAEILKSLNDLKTKTEQAIKAKDVCILRLASGSGFHSITGNWQNETDHLTRWNQKDNHPFNKTRRFAVDGKRFLPMGFVKLTILKDKSTYQLRMAEHQQNAVESNSKTKTQTKEWLAKVISSEKGNIKLSVEGYEEIVFRLTQGPRDVIPKDTLVMVKNVDKKQKLAVFKNIINP